MAFAFKEDTPRFSFKEEAPRFAFKEEAPPSEATPTAGFSENLSPNIKNAVSTVTEGFSKGIPDGLQSLSKAANFIKAEGKKGFFGDAVKIATGEAEKDLKSQQSEFKKFLADDVLADMEELEQAGSGDTPQFKKLEDKFHNIMNTSEKDLFTDKDEKSPTLTEIKDAITADPGAFGAEMVNMLVQDPVLAITPFGWRAAAAKSAASAAKFGKVAAKTAEIAGGTAGVAAVTAGVVAPISIADQIVEKGEVDLGQTAQEVGIATAISAPLGFAFAGKAAVRTASRASGIPEKTVERILKTEVRAGKSIDNAVDDFIELTSKKAEAPKVSPKAESKSAIVEFQKSLPPTTRLTLSKLAKENDNTIKFIQKQTGSVNPKVLAATALTGAGALIGSKDGIEGTIGGALLGLAAFQAGRVLGKIGKNSIGIMKKLAEKDTRIRIDKFADDADGMIAAGQRASFQVKETVKQLVPDIKRREAISHYLEGDKTVKLTPNETEAAKGIKKFFDEYAKIGKDEGVISGVLDDYVPHLWESSGAAKSKILEALEIGGYGSRSSKTIHAKQRTIPTLKEGIDAGLKPRTLDIADISKIYGDAIIKAIANKKMIAALKNEVDETGRKLILPAKDAPRSYVPINHPQLAGMKVHPDIKPSMELLFSATDPGVLKKGLLAVNFASKRFLVSTSAFHANALMESMMFAGSIPLGKGVFKAKKGLPKVALKRGESDLLSGAAQKDILSARQGKNAPLEMLRNGRAGDAVDTALRAGLKIGTIEDVGTDLFYGVLKDTRVLADKIVPIVPGKIIGAFEKANLFVDNIMWDKINTGFKLSVFMKEYEKQLIKSAKRFQKNPKKFPLESNDVIAADVAEFVNDAFGGQNWRRLAEGPQNKILRDISTKALSPRGRQTLQLALFAPDWTLSNLRVLGKAIPGLSKNSRIANMHRRYAMRSAVFFFVAGNMLNKAFSGHFMWENEGDPFAIELGDGRKMTWSKQVAEVFHWATKPGKTALNKAGIIPKTGAEIIAGKKYLTVNQGEGEVLIGPNMFERGDTKAMKSFKVGKHIGGKFVPIWVQQVEQQGTEAALSGFLGHPIYGKKE